MRSHVPVLAAALLAGLGTIPPAHAAHARHDPAQAPDAAQAPTQRWAADRPLAEGMRGIRAAVDALGQHAHGPSDPDRVALLAGQIEDHVNQIIANCRLAPEADAALHGIIVPLLRNAGELERNPGALDAIAPMRDALASYERLFFEGATAAQD